MKLRSLDLFKGEHLIVSTNTTSTITAMISSDLTGSLVFVGSLLLLILLFLKELAVASADSRLHKISQVLDISLPPLVFVFFLVMIFKVMEVLD